MKPRMRIEGRDFALTFPKCDVAALLLQEHFWILLGEKLSYTAVAQETHQDGSYHLHAQLQFKKLFKASERTFDYGSFHCNIQRTKSSTAWKEYIEKAGKPATKGEWEDIAKPKTEKKEKLTNAELLTGDLVDLINTERLSIFSLKAVLQARKCWTLLQESPHEDLDTVLPDYWEGLELKVAEPEVKQRHYWLWSSMPNKGKTSFLRLLKQKYRCSYYSCREKYQEMGQDSEVVLFDEFGPGNNIQITILNQICDGTYQYPAKGRQPTILDSPLVILCSNFDISHAYPNSNGRVEARFNEICLDNLIFKK